MTADMRAHGVGREMKDEGNVPGGLAFHTKVIDCNFILRFHINISFPLMAGEQPRGLLSRFGVYAFTSRHLTASDKTSFASTRSEVMYAT